MSTYRFDGVHDVDIQNPTITLDSYLCRPEEGTVLINILLSQGQAPNGTKLMVEFTGLTYTGSIDDATVLAWAIAELVQYEV